MPSAPHWLPKALVLTFTRLAASRPDRMSSAMVTSTPLPLALGDAATTTASYRFSKPSADIALPGRMEPTTTMGLSLLITRFRKKAVSSSVSVPWVTTTPLTSGSFSSAETRLPRVTSLSLVKLSEAIWKACSPRTLATLVSSGTPAISLSTGTLAAW